MVSLSLASIANTWSLGIDSFSAHSMLFRCALVALASLRRIFGCAEKYSLVASLNFAWHWCKHFWVNLLMLDAHACWHAGHERWAQWYSLLASDSRWRRDVDAPTRDWLRKWRRRSCVRRSFGTLFHSGDLASFRLSAHWRGHCGWSYSQTWFSEEHSTSSWISWLVSTVISMKKNQEAVFVLRYFFSANSWPS